MAVVVADFVNHIAGGLKAIEYQSLLVLLSQELVIAVSLDNCTEVANRWTHHWSCCCAHVNLGVPLHEHLNQ